MRQLFRLQNVSTKRRDKINSDEEERMRQGYEIITGMRFAEQSERPAYRVAKIVKGEDVLAKLTYGHSATLWRINLGWRRRKNKDRYGFVLDVERGYWAKNEVTEEENNQDDPLSPRTAWVIPYVEDRRNALLFEPTQKISASAMASLQSALKSAIQVQFQLEDNELAVEPLPNADDRRLILLYESAEGGAGVLRRLLDDSQAFALVAQEALRLCHFDPETGADLRRAPRAREDCEAACYDCLMNYYNQRDHALLDRQGIRDILMQLTQAQVLVSPVGLSRGDHLQQLLRLTDSDLERQWLKYLEGHAYHLPSHAQTLIEACSTRPDFIYQEHQAAIYIDGPHHKYPERQARDKAQTECMENQGYTVIRFGLEDDWDKIVAQFPYVFGRTQ
jgi:very-short-patch-repair endonuclease